MGAKTSTKCVQEIVINLRNRQCKAARIKKENLDVVVKKQLYNLNKL